MDREAWRAVFHGVAKSRTRLSDWTELNWTERLNNNNEVQRGSDMLLPRQPAKARRAWCQLLHPYPTGWHWAAGARQEVVWVTGCSATTLDDRQAVWQTCTEACRCAWRGWEQEVRWKVLCSSETQEMNTLWQPPTRQKLPCGGSSPGSSPITPGGITQYFTKLWSVHSQVLLIRPKWRCARSAGCHDWAIPLSG